MKYKICILTEISTDYEHPLGPDRRLLRSDDGRVRPRGRRDEPRQPHLQVLPPGARLPGRHRAGVGAQRPALLHRRVRADLRLRIDSGEENVLQSVGKSLA